MRNARIVCCALAFFLVSAGVLHAQQDPNLESGIKPFAAYSGGNIDTISIENGQLSLRIPLISYPQRGGKLKLDYVLRYADVGAETVPQCYYIAYGNYYICIDVPVSIVGWCGGTGESDGDTTLCHGFRLVDEDNATGYNGATIEQSEGLILETGGVMMPDGAMHGAEPTFGNSSYSYWETVDATAFKEIIPNGGGSTTAIDPDGTQYIWPASGSRSRVDTNGNTITYSDSSNVGATDTMGRVIPSVPTATSAVTGCPVPPAVPHTPTSSTTWAPPGLNGPNNYPILFCYIQLSEMNPIGGGCPGASPVPPLNCTPYTYTASELQSVVLPDQNSWTFEYTSDSNADLAEVIFPTGGTLSFGNWSGETSDTLIFNRIVGTRTLNANDGVTPASTWTYAFNSPNAAQVTVSSPATIGSTADQIVYSMTGGPVLGIPSEVQYYQGAATGTPLKTTSTQYSYYYDPVLNLKINIVPSQTSTTWANGQQSKTTYTYDSGFHYCYPYFLLNPPFALGSGNCNAGTGIYGKPITKQEYDYSGTLLRTTTTSWLALSNTNYANANLLDLPSSVQVTGSGPGSLTNYGYDEGESGIHGNLTSTHRWLNTNGSYLVTSNVYDSYGRVTSTTDPKNNPPTTYGYGGSYAGSGPTSVTNALGQSTSYAYDFNTGLLTSTTDPNNQTTSYQYDDMFRATQINYPDGGETAFTYPDPNDVDISEKISSSANRLSYVKVDGVGRAIRQAVTNEESLPYDETNTCYDGNGRVSFKSYPFQDSGPFSTARSCASPELGDSFGYDALGRAKTVTHSDGSAISTSYTGNSATVTDEAGKTRESFADGLGRLEEVIEDPGTSPHLNYASTYAYDALDDLIGVTQAGSRQRTFVYDSLSRLTSSTNPESNYSPANQTYLATTYAYDADGNLVNKTEPAQNQQGTATVTLTYCYDALGRMIAKAYTLQPCTSTGGRMATPLVSYVYDGAALPSAPPGCTLGSFSYGFAVGRRTAMCEGTGEVEGWSYSITSGQGWKTTDQRTTNSLTKTATYQYNFLGSPTSIIYPSGRVINYAYNLGDRATSATDQTTLVNYANTVHYWAGGSPCWAAYGAAITAAETYNPRLQPSNMQATGSVITYPGSCSGLGQTGNLLDLGYNFNLGSGDNGNVMGITNNRDTTRSQSFGYDALNRLLTAATASTYSTSPSHCWGENYQFDNQTTGGAWGNLSAITQMTGNYTGCTGEVLAGITVTAQNRISNGSTYYYDTAGNMMTISGVAYNYDAENHLTSTAGVTYTYNGDGTRIEKSNGVIDWLGVDGNVLDRTDLTGSVTNSNFQEFFFLGGRRIARRDSSNNVIYYAADHLGTSRVIAQVNSGSNTATLCYDADFYPFGGERAYTNTCSQAYKFTGKERDSESNLDNFGARYDSSAMGRFMTPDPLNLTDDRVLNPANTLNKYAYAGNNPLYYVDDDGRDIVALYEASNYGGSSAGHFMLFANNPSTGESAMMSFGPKDESGGNRYIMLAGGPVSSTTSFDLPLTADQLRDNFTALTIQTTPEQAQEVLNYIKTFSPSSNDYKLYSQNCTTVCRDALKAAGLISKGTTNWSPDGLWKTVFDRYAANTFWNRFYKRVGDTRSTPGKDLGNPRFGMDPFDFIALQLKRQRACVTTYGSDGNGGVTATTTCN